MKRGTPFQEISNECLKFMAFRLPEPRSFEELRVAAASSVRGGFLGMTTLRNGYLPRSSLQHALNLNKRDGCCFWL